MFEGESEDKNLQTREQHEEEIDAGPILAYLQSGNGHELASRTLKIIEDIKKATLEKTSRRV